MKPLLCHSFARTLFHSFVRAFAISREGQHSYTTNKLSRQTVPFLVHNSAPAVPSISFLRHFLLLQDLFLLLFLISPILLSLPEIHFQIHGKRQLLCLHLIPIKQTGLIHLQQKCCTTFISQEGKNHYSLAKLSSR